MKVIIAIGLVTCFVISAFNTIPQKSKWTKLFNGKDLTGWHTIPGGTWTVENGIIVGKSLKEDERHGLLVSNEKFKDFEIEVTYKALQGNSGLYFRIEEVGGVAGVKGFQAEIDPNVDAGGLYETNGRAWVVQPSTEDIKKYFKPGEWNTMSVSAIGGNIIVRVNGIISAQLTNDAGNTEGNIALQLHGGQNMHVMFKDVKIKKHNSK